MSLAHVSMRQCGVFVKSLNCCKDFPGLTLNHKSKGSTGVSAAFTIKAHAKVFKKSKLNKKEEANNNAQKVWPKSWSPWWGWDGTADEDMGALEAWLRSQGMPPQKVTLNPVQEGERGLVAKQDIGKGETLLFVPENMIITAKTVYACPTVGKLLKESGVPEWPALAIYLLSEGSKGKNSVWNTYLEALPQNPGCVLMWPVEEVDFLLQGSPVRQKAIECTAEVTDTYNDLNKVLFSKHPTIFPPELFTLGAFKWAFSILFSRLVKLTSKGGKLALVPWADMINHKCDVDVYLDYDILSKSVVLKSSSKYNKGQQVYVSYGPRSNGDLLVSYGMVPAGRNPNNSVEVRLGLSPSIETDPLLETKARILTELGLTSPSSYPVKMEGMPLQMLAFARFASAGPSTSLETLRQIAVDSRMEIQPINTQLKLPKLSLTSASLSLDEEITARELILAACQVALSGYSTSLEDDESLLEKAETFMAAALASEDEVAILERAVAAAALRAAEKKILYRLDAVLRAELRDMKKALVSAVEGKALIDLGNNFGGRNKGPLNDILRKITNPW